MALTFDDGPSPYTDRLLQILKDNDAKATFFLIGNKVAANPAGAKRIADAGMEIGNHTWEHPNMTTIPPEDIAAHSSARPTTRSRPRPAATRSCVRTAGGLINDHGAGRGRSKQGLADINWDVIPFDWANDSNTAATRYMLMTQIKPGSVVLFHDTYSSTVDLVYQFIPVLKANGYHLVTVSQLLGPRDAGQHLRQPGQRPAGQRPARHPARRDPDAAEHAVAQPMPNFPITDIPGANSGGPNNGA